MHLPRPFISAWYILAMPLKSSIYLQDKPDVLPTEHDYKEFYWLYIILQMKT